MICILLATYNGARFLPQLLASIQQQSVSNWCLLVRDDGSTDETLSIVVAAAAQDCRIRLIRDELGRQGAAQNFGILMTEALKQGADYLLFADQDDIWLPFKIEQQLAAARRLEGAFGKRLPLLVHTDLTVVDERLRVRKRSFVQTLPAQRAQESSLASLLIYNRVTGCATLVNRRLAQLALPIPARAVIHDWWLGLIAAACGRLEFIETSTVLYRQHAGNAIGAHGLAAKLNPLRRDWLSRIFEQSGSLARAVVQGASLAERIRASRLAGCEPALSVIERFVATFETGMPWWQRYARLRQSGVVQVTPLRRGLLALRLILDRSNWSLRPSAEPNLALDPHAASTRRAA